MNTLSTAELKQLWLPRLLFANTEQREGLVRDDRASATVNKMADVTLASDDRIDNTYVSTGADNPITLKRTYKGGCCARYSKS